MDFFDQQDRARKRTSRLLVLFVLAVVVIFVILYAGAAWVVTAVDAGRAVRSFDDPQWWWIPDLFITLLIGHLSIVGIGSWLKIRELSEGGATVARMLGGREVDPLDASPEEQRLLNVVEEMAIASGMPVPRVFVLDHEWGLNAFAAGFGIDDAAVAVTRGGIRSWTRDELQGVVAHEFSHILNGDMRLNIRMIGILQGLVSIAAIGAILIRSGAHFGGFRGRSHSNRNGLAPAMGLMAAGFFVYVVGWIGVMAGRIIRSGVSREREYLADASAVQFTRNPAGLAGALRKVGGAETGSEVENPRAEEASHLFFGNAIRARFLSGLFASHPPLNERIRRLDPSFHGAFHRFEVTRSKEGGEHHFAAPEQPISALEGAALPMAMMAAGSETRVPGQQPSPDAFTKPEGLVTGNRVRKSASLSPEHLRYSGRVIEEMPHALLAEAHDPVGASAILFVLLLSNDEAVRAEQLLYLSDHVDVATTDTMARLEDDLAALAPHLRLPLVELTFPALLRTSQSQRRELLRRLDEMGAMEPTLTVMRFALRKVVRRRLTGEARKQARVDFYTPGPLRGDVVFLLSVLCRVGSEDVALQEKAFRAGIATVPMMRGVPASQLPPETCTFRALDSVLDRLGAAAPLLKRQVIDAATACVLFDEVVTLEEAELLRLIADVLGIAMPPFLPGAGNGSPETDSVAAAPQP